MHDWLLPEYIEDVLPPQAWRLESARRAILDLFRGNGYELIFPPLLEYVESLLTGTGRDLDLVTFKLVDQLSGRHMGLRADITPQAARIDAHLMNRHGVNRLCYAGAVLHTLPDGMMGTREQLQIGAELFGHAGSESDLEVQRLMLQALKLAGVANAIIDLGHVAIFRTLVARAGAAAELEAELFQALQLKDGAALRSLTRSLDSASGAALQMLPELNGGFEVLDEAAQVLPAHPRLGAALSELRSLGETLRAEATAVTFDLAELRGYHYHSGMVFAAYAAGYPDAVAKGGRYDEVGKSFGRARPATGFSMDLREIVRGESEARAAAILAPHGADPSLALKVAELRAAGEIVIIDLPGHAGETSELNCDRKLVKQGKQWQVVGR
jgi:ATP phosphoribosyltransferase regulatory subunit